MRVRAGTVTGRAGGAGTGRARDQPSSSEIVTRSAGDRREIGGALPRFEVRRVTGHQAREGDAALARGGHSRLALDGESLALLARWDLRALRRLLAARGVLGRPRWRRGRRLGRGRSPRAGGRAGRTAWRRRGRGRLAAAIARRRAAPPKLRACLLRLLCQSGLAAAAARRCVRGRFDRGRGRHPGHPEQVGHLVRVSDRLGSGRLGLRR